MHGIVWNRVSHRLRTSRAVAYLPFLTALSSRAANSPKLIPKARQKVLNSTTSTRRSPRSHLLTNVCFSPMRFATSSWVSPARSRVARNTLRKTAYEAEWMDLSIAFVGNATELDY